MIENTNIQLKKADKITMAVIGVVVLAFVAIPVLTWFSTVMALLATIAANTAYFFGTMGVLLVSIAWLWENRTSLLYQWKNFARNLRRTVARENPIGVMDTAITRFQSKLGMIDDNVIKADGARKQQLKAIKEMRAKALESQRLADAAMGQGKPDAEIARYAAAADRWNASADKLEPLASKLSEIHEKMQQAREVCHNRLEDMKNRREVFNMEYTTMMTGQKAVKGFKSFFGANPDLEMLQLSVEEIDRQTAEAEAEIDQFLHDIKPGIEANNLQKEAAEQAALARMKAPQAQAALTSGSPTLNLPKVKEGTLVKGLLIALMAGSLAACDKITHITGPDTQIHVHVELPPDGLKPGTPVAPPEVVVVVNEDNPDPDNIPDNEPVPVGPIDPITVTPGPFNPPSTTEPCAHPGNGHGRGGGNGTPGNGKGNGDENRCK